MTTHDYIDEKRRGVGCFSKAASVTPALRRQGWSRHALGIILPPPLDACPHARKPHEH